MVSVLKEINEQKLVLWLNVVIIFIGLRLPNRKAKDDADDDSAGRTLPQRDLSAQPRQSATAPTFVMAAPNWSTNSRPSAIMKMSISEFRWDQRRL
jgi:hypothetical protein